MTRPRLVLLTTGGTIGSRRDPVSGAVMAVASPDELLAAVPGLDQLAEISARPLFTVNSWNLTPEHMFAIVQAVRDAAADDTVDAIVITHGTDTLEETSLMVDLATRTEKPIVFTAAMRNMSDAGADGPRNLTDAVLVATHPASVGRGTLAVINERIHHARAIVKTDTVNPATFRSPAIGPVGQVTGGEVRYLLPSPPEIFFDMQRVPLPLPIIAAVSGTDGGVVRWAREAGAVGMVLEGAGAGNVPALMMDEVQAALDAGIPVASATRVWEGFLSPSYGTGARSGGGFDMIRMGVMPSMYWRAAKARIAMLVALGAGASHARLAALLADPLTRRVAEPGET